MLVVKIGGPAYRIGMGGGAASSVPSGSNSADLDFNAVQVSAALEQGRGADGWHNTADCDARGPEWAMHFWEGCAACGPTRPAACAACLQRGDAEVSQKLWRVVRACVELGEDNPIEQIHDQVWGGTELATYRTGVF